VKARVQASNLPHHLPHRPAGFALKTISPKKCGEKYPDAQQEYNHA